MTTPRQLPGTRSVCARCRRTIVWATTVAGPNGSGGKSQPFDPEEHPEGNVAVYPSTHGRLRARALQRGETHDRQTEFLAMPHAATCTKAPAPKGPPLPDNVIDLAAARRRRKARR